MGKKKTKKVKIRNIEANRINSIKREIKKHEKKLKKLLARFSEGRKRWRWKNRKEKEELDKFQGIAPRSKRHERMEAHIKFLKALV